MKVIAITAVVLIIIITGFLIGCTIAAMHTTKKSFNCKYCRRFNKILTGKCLHCGSDAIYKKVSYRSFILGKINNIDKDGNCSWDKTKRIMIVESIIWAILLIAEIWALVSIIIKM